MEFSQLTTINLPDREGKKNLTGVPTLAHPIQNEKVLSRDTFERASYTNLKNADKSTNYQIF